jgi:hypothetical protein
MGLSNVFAALTAELTLVTPRYEVQRVEHPTLAKYETLDALFAATEPKQEGKRRLVSPEGSAVLVALVELHASTRDRLWGALLLRAFRPMLEKVSRSLHGGTRNDRDSALLVSFHEALLRVDPKRDAARIAMYVRQETRRRVFRALGDEVEWQGVGFGDDVELCADPTVFEPRLLGRRLTTRDAVTKAAPQRLFETKMDRGALWTFVRTEHAALPAREQARIYRRLQKRRHRMVGELRRRLIAKAQSQLEPLPASTTTVDPITTEVR